MTSFLSGLLSSLKDTFFTTPTTAVDPIASSPSDPMPSSSEQASMENVIDSQSNQQQLDHMQLLVKPNQDNFDPKVPLSTINGEAISAEQSTKPSINSLEELLHDDQNHGLENGVADGLSKHDSSGDIQLLYDSEMLLGFEAPCSNFTEHDSFGTANSRFVADFNDSVEPMDVDVPMDIDDFPVQMPVLADQHTNDSSFICTQLPKAGQISEETIISNDVMSAEEQSSFIAPAAASISTSGDVQLEEKPVCGKGAYAIDWDNFDENSVPNPFGARATSGGKAKVTAGVKRSPKKPTKADEAKNLQQTAAEADKNANEILAVDKSSNIQKGPSPDTKAASDDLKNSNLISGDDMNMVGTNSDNDQQKAKETTRNVTPKPIRQPNQQTAVVAPTVHVPSTITDSGQPDNASTTNRNVSRASAKATATVQQTVTVPPVQHDRGLSPKRGRSGEDSVSEEEMFVMASSDPFNDTAAFEYLQKAGQCAPGGKVSNLHRQSLYTNFDPLVAGGDATTASPANVHSRQRSPAPAAAVDSAVSLSDITVTEDDLVMLSTPTKVGDRSAGDQVPPTPSTVVKKKQGPKTQANGNGSLTEVDQLLTATPPQTAASPNASPAATQEMKSQFQALFLAKEKEYLSRLQEEKDKRIQVEQELASMKKEAETAKLSAGEMSFVVAEYEKTVRQLIAERDKPKQGRLSGEFDVVAKDRDQALENLQTVENAFSELNRRYETLRNSTMEYKKNEEILKKTAADYQQKLKKLEEKFSKLHSHAEYKLDLANQEIERLHKARENDTLALRALLKKRDLQVETFEKNLEQKQKEIDELTAICDELIQKAGGP